MPPRRVILNSFQDLKEIPAQGRDDNGESVPRLLCHPESYCYPGLDPGYILDTASPYKKELKKDLIVPMPMSPDHIKTLILQTFPDAQIELHDTRGDHDHYTAQIITEAFRGKTRIQQHQMVYDALNGHMGTTLHALSLKTQPPMEP